MENTSRSSLTYAQAGVDIEAGNQLVERIKPLAKSTLRPGADNELGGFGGLFDLAKLRYDDPILVSGTDGVGTKLKIAFAVDKHDTIGIDLVAMCVNDIIVQGAEPLFFLDYFATGALDVDRAAAVVSGIAEGCRQSSAALIGGETAEMPGMYQAGHYDLAGFAVGAVERTQILPRQNIAEGDVLLGLASSGLHSNGFSLARKIIETAGLDFHSPAPFADGKTLGDALLEPTKIYVKSCLSAIKTGHVKALAHITGGGLTENLPRVLPEGLAAKIDIKAWQRPALFDWLQEAGNVTETEMLRTFNCGVGMVLIVPAEAVSSVAAALTAAGETVAKIGRLTARKNEAVVYTEA